MILGCVDEQLGDFRPAIVANALIGAAYTFSINANLKGPAAFAALLETMAADIRNGKITFYFPDDVGES